MFTRSSALSSPHFAHVDWIRIEVLFDADASAESYAERDAGAETETETETETDAHAHVLASLSNEAALKTAKGVVVRGLAMANDPAIR